MCWHCLVAIMGGGVALCKSLLPEVVSTRATAFGPASTNAPPQNDNSCMPPGVCYLLAWCVYRCLPCRRIAEDSIKNYQLWNHRRKLALALGPEAAEAELDFCAGVWRQVSLPHAVSAGSSVGRRAPGPQNHHTASCTICLEQCAHRVAAFPPHSWQTHVHTLHIPNTL